MRSYKYSWAGLLAALLCLPSCGGGGGDSTPRPATLAELQASIQSSLNGTKGDEVTIAPTSGSVNIGAPLNFTYAMNGFALCQPAVSFPVANPNPVPPSNRYGCINNLVLNLTQTGPNTLSATFSVSPIFIDLSVTWDAVTNILAAGSSAVSVSSNVTGSFTLNLTDSGGLKKVVSVALGSFTVDLVTLNNTNVVFSDSTINAFASTLAPLFQTPVASALQTQLETFLNDHVSSYPQFMP